MVPDAEAIVGDYLRDLPAIQEQSARVVGETPDDKSAPWVQVTQLDYPPLGGHRSEYQLEWMGQLDCYAGKSGGQTEASLLMRTVREAIKNLPEATIPGVVFTGARTISSPRIPDTDLEPAIERFAMTVALDLHPA